MANNTYACPENQKLSMTFVPASWLIKFISNTDPCESSPCKNGGKCSSEKGKWKCNCISKFIGSTCEDEKNPCQKIPYNPCLNGGTCVPTSDDAISCSCPSGFQGALCKEKVDEKEKEEENDNKGGSYIFFLVFLRGSKKRHPHGI